MFKVNTKDNRMISLTSFWSLKFKHFTFSSIVSIVSIVDFEHLMRAGIVKKFFPVAIN